MWFDYDQYFRGCCMIPLSVVILALPAFFVCIYQAVYDIMHHALDSTEIMKLTLIACTSLFFLVINGGTLVNGGWQLLHETEAAAIPFTGQVESIEQLNRVSFPGNLKCDTKHDDPCGVRMVVGGMECIAITNGSFSVGDNVLITYLPHSKYVLSMNYSLPN